MSGEDVYDVARRWCHVCDADHADCDPTWLDDLDYECCNCNGPLSDERYEAGELFCEKCAGGSVKEEHQP